MAREIPPTGGALPHRATYGGGGSRTPAARHGQACFRWHHALLPLVWHLAAAGAGALGWFLAGFRLTDSSWVLMTHRWLGTSTVACTGLALVLSEASRRQTAEGPASASGLRSLPSRHSFRSPVSLEVRWSTASIITPGRAMSQVTGPGKDRKEDRKEDRKGQPRNRGSQCRRRGHFLAEHALISSLGCLK